MIFLQNITTLDFAFLCPNTGLWGESYHVHAEIHGNLNEIGFVMDFGPAKKLLKQVLDESVDHRVVLPYGSANQWTGGFDFSTALKEFFTYQGPSSSYLVLPGQRISKEAIAAYLEQACMAVMPANISAVKLQIVDDPRFQTEANFRYTHGLRKHESNCLRLFHGHRNPIEVRIEGLRSQRWETFLATKFDGAHFAHIETLRTRNLDLQKSKRRTELGALSAEISYIASQGNFMATLPASRLVIMEEEPSIENIAKLFWQQIAEEERGIKELEVTAYEGLNKGARYKQ